MSVVLEYFDGRGRAEVARMILAVGDAKYEDKRFSFDKWPEHKPTTPLGSMPVLVVDGKVKIAQSGTIVRYLAAKHGLQGKKATDTALIDMVYETLNEVYFKLPLFEKDAEVKATKTKEILEKNIVPALTLANKLSGKKFMFGDALSYADLALVNFVDNVAAHTDICLSKYPNLAAVNTNVLAVPKLKKWMETRPKTQF